MNAPTPQDRPADDDREHVESTTADPAAPPQAQDASDDGGGVWMLTLTMWGNDAPARPYSSREAAMKALAAAVRRAWFAITGSEYPNPNGLPTDRITAMFFNDPTLCHQTGARYTLERVPLDLSDPFDLDSPHVDDLDAG